MACLKCQIQVGPYHHGAQRPALHCACSGVQPSCVAVLGCSKGSLLIIETRHMHTRCLDLQLAPGCMQGITLGTARPLKGHRQLCRDAHMTANLCLQASLGGMPLQQRRSNLQDQMSRLRLSLVGSWAACGGDSACQCLMSSNEVVSVSTICYAVRCTRHHML